MDLRALKDEANRLLAKGKFDRAAALLWEGIRLHGDDAQLRLRHGDACRRAGRSGLAVASYRVAAELLAQSGHLVRAMGAMRLALDIAPRDPALEEAMQRLQRMRATEEPRRPPSYPRLEPFELELDSSAEPEPAQPPPVAEPQVRPYPRLRRLSPFVVALQPAEGARWLVLKADSPIHLGLEDSVEDVAVPARTFSGEVLAIGDPAGTRRKLTT